MELLLLICSKWVVRFLSSCIRGDFIRGTGLLVRVDDRVCVAER